MYPSRRVLGSLAISLGLVIAQANPQNLWASPAIEPAATDVLPVPPSMSDVVLRSHGSRMNGLIYKAAGEGPHPVALFLHGFPGVEKNLDLAQSVRRAGWDAIYFNYRGSWGAGGTFSFGNALEDVATMLAWIRAPENAARHHLDPTRIAIVGHSFGGWLALMTARKESKKDCVAVMAAWNVGWQARRLADHPEEDAQLMEAFRDTTDPEGGPLRSTPGALFQEVASSPVDWDYRVGVEGLKDRPVLLVSATMDTPDEDPAMHEQLLGAVREAGGRQVRHVVLEDDHAFSSTRVQLADILVQWLNSDCAAHHALE